MIISKKRERERVKLAVRTKIIIYGPITSRKIDGETVTDFIFWGSKITEDGDCSYGIKGLLLFGRKDMTNLHSVLKGTYSLEEKL